MEEERQKRSSASGNQETTRFCDRTKFGTAVQVDNFAFRQQGNEKSLNFSKDYMST